jgi:hypothetical protein
MITPCFFNMVINWPGIFHFYKPYEDHSRKVGFAQCGILTDGTIQTARLLSRF